LANSTMLSPAFSGYVLAAQPNAMPRLAARSLRGAVQHEHAGDAFSSSGPSPSSRLSTGILATLLCTCRRVLQVCRQPARFPRQKRVQVRASQKPFDVCQESQFQVRASKNPFDVCQDFGERIVDRFAESTRNLLEELDPGHSFVVQPGKDTEVPMLLEGDVFEKASIHIGKPVGTMPEQMRQVTSTLDSAGVGDLKFQAASLSVVIHPRSPHVPSLHFNYRCFATEEKWWFGGGSDLSPSYIDNDDCACFHHALQKACEASSAVQYENLKEACDQYFSLPHREENRGVGGVIFDDLSGDVDDLMNFVTSLLTMTLRAYGAIAKKNRFRSYGTHEKEWQLFRRGRYAEFNLLCDRGTHWGLQMPDFVTAQNVLLASPPATTFPHTYVPNEGTAEAESMRIFKKPLAWSERECSSAFMF